MKKLIKKTDSPLYAYFKLFSVGFTTVTLVGICSSYYDETNVYIATLMALPFAWYYAFNWIGEFERKEAIVPILVSGLFMMSVYSTWTDGIEQYFKNKALAPLATNVDYQELKKKHDALVYDAEAHRLSLQKYTNTEATLESFLKKQKQWISSKEAELLAIKFEADGKTKSLDYKSAVSDALNFRSNHPELDLPKNLRTPRDVALILYEKELNSLKELNSPKKIEALKAAADALSFDALKEKRDNLKAEYKTMETEALRGVPSKDSILIGIFVLGFFVEIVLNALSLWRNLLSRGKKEGNKISSMLTLLNKPLLMDRLKRLNVVYESGKNKGKVEALYATLINIVVLYNEREKTEFKRYKDITNKDISNFRYLDVEARRHIREAFDLLAGIKVADFHLEELEEVIKNHKNS